MSFACLAVLHSIAPDQLAWHPDGTNDLVVTAAPSTRNPCIILVFCEAYAGGVSIKRDWIEVDLAANPFFCEAPARINSLVNRMREMTRRDPIMSPRRYGIDRPALPMPSRHIPRRQHHHHRDDE
jgi:hypothetical protein